MLQSNVGLLQVKNLVIDLIKNDSNVTSHNPVGITNKNGNHTVKVVLNNPNDADKIESNKEILDARNIYFCADLTPSRQDNLKRLRSKAVIRNESRGECNFNNVFVVSTLDVLDKNNICNISTYYQNA